MLPVYNKAKPLNGEPKFKVFEQIPTMATENVQKDYLKTLSKQCFGL